MGFYASEQTNDWKRRIVARWPPLHSHVYTVEVCEKNVAYALLRRTMRSTVTRNWTVNATLDCAHASRHRCYVTRYVTVSTPCMIRSR
jgi:hypothetical protein